MSAWNAPSGTAQCAAPCTRTYSLSGGVLSSDSPTPAPAGVSIESQPRIAPGGNLVENYALYPNAAPGALGAASMAGLFERSPGEPFAGPWADTATETLAALRRPRARPGRRLACGLGRRPGLHDLRAPRLAGLPVRGPRRPRGRHEPCRRSRSSTTRAPAATGPRRCRGRATGASCCSSTTSRPTTGSTRSPRRRASRRGTKTVTELISEPPGWTFGQARFAGSHVIFSAAGEGHSKAGTSDIYSISASCNSGTCAFPLNATNLTNDAAADNVDPAWTSAAAPLPPLGDTQFRERRRSRSTPRGSSRRRSPPSRASPSR